MTDYNYIFEDALRELFGANLDDREERAVQIIEMFLDYVDDRGLEQRELAEFVLAQVLKALRS